MSEKRFVLTDAAPVTMTGDAAARIISGGNGDAALMYIYILKNGGKLSVGEAASATGFTETRVNAALSALASMGLLSRGDAKSAPERAMPPLPADELPQYSAADIKNELQSGGGFSALVSEVQRSLGKVLSSADLTKLFGIYDHLGLPPEVILTLVAHCTDECRRRYGEGRLPTMRYIESAAFKWEREGIRSIETAEAYIKRETELRGKRAEIRKTLGITDREPTRTEREYIDRWLGMGHAQDAIALAYDRTVMQTGRLAWKYMDKILADWASKGLYTAKDAEKGDRRTKPAPTVPAKGKTTPSGDDMARMRKLLDSIKNGQE